MRSSRLVKLRLNSGRLLDFFLAKSRGHVSAVGLDQRYLVGGDNESFLSSSDLKLYIDTCGLIGIHGNAGGHYNFESNVFGANVILAGNEVSNGIVAGLIGGGLKRGTFLSSGDR